VSEKAAKTIGELIKRLQKVPGCVDCHHWLDYGKASRDEKQDAFMAALERWWLYAWDNELLEVA
jgi:hypothetical protein